MNAATHRDYGIKGTDIQIKMFDDRLEVDSPGTFAGMVKKENIRYTHFSRNPKIAAFLKDYGYVKEYGEGVDRMCRELTAIGLPEPVFNNSTFILKTTVKSSSYKMLSTENQKNAEIDEIHSENARNVAESEENRPLKVTQVSESNKKLPIKDPKVTDSGEKLPIKDSKVTVKDKRQLIESQKNAGIEETYSEKARNVSESEEDRPLKDPTVTDSGEKWQNIAESEEKLPIKELKVTNSDDRRLNNAQKIAESEETLQIKESQVRESDKKLPIKEVMGTELSEKLPIKISIKSYVQTYLNKGYSEPTILKLNAIYDDIELNQVFGTAYLMKILECSERTARGLLAKLREMDVVIEVIGKGRGRSRGMYRFKYEGEK